MPRHKGRSSSRFLRPRSAANLTATITAAALAVSCAGRSSPPQDASSAPSGSAIIATVVDGDTVELTFGTTVERVRLLGVDAPESVHPSVPVQCFGDESAEALSRLLPAGTVVRVRRDVDGRDRYGRLLLHLYRSEDDLFVNRWLVDNGFADTAFYEPNHAHYAELSAARNTARASGLGLWGSCDGPDQPVE